MMRAEFAATPEIVSAPTVAPTQRIAPRAGGEVEPALIGRILWRRRKLIAGAALLAALAALGYSLVATPQYNAVAQILVDPRDKQVVSNDVNPSSIAADGGVTQVESQGSVLQSSGVLLRAIAATHLESDPEFNGSGLFSALSRFASLLSRPDPREIADRLKAETLQNLRKHMVVKRAEKVLVLDLSVRARTPDRAAELANAIAEAYLADQADARSAAGREASNALSGRLDELQQNVEKAENEVADYRAAHDVVVSAGTLVSDQELNQTTAQLTAAQNRAASLKSQLDQLRAAGSAEATPEAMASGVMVRLRDRESAIVERLGDASKKYGPLHPEIASLNQSLADVRALIAKEAQRLRQAAQADYARAVDDEKSLAKKLAAMKSKSLDNVKSDTQLRQLQSQAEAARSLYQAFLARSRETMEASNVDTTNVRIITRALPPIQKSWPPTLLLMLGAGFLGLSLSASGVLAREYLRPTLYTPGQARDLADAAALGVVSVDEFKPDAKSRRALDALALRALRALGEDNGAEDASVGRALCLAATPAAAPWRQRLAERIAALAASEGRETLLIDADLGAEASDRPGLLDFLRGDQTVADLAYREGAEPFARLAVGGGDPLVAPKRGGGDAFRLRRLKRHYETLIIDAAVLGDNPRMAALTNQTEYVLVLAMLGEPQTGFAREIEAAGRVDAVALIDAGLV